MTFKTAVDHVLKVEGGLVEHPDDPGGLTNMGISLRAHPELGREGIRSLTRSQAIDIYYRKYWLPLNPDDLERRLAILAFDTAVNSGLYRAQRWLRDHPRFESFLAYRLRFYARLQTFGVFGRGWVNRMASLLELVTSEYENPLLPVTELFVYRRSGEVQAVPLHKQRPARVVGDKLYANEAK